MQILDSGDLLISNVRETDGGLYTCIRENEAGRVIGSGYLTVLGMSCGKIGVSVTLETFK